MILSHLMDEGAADVILYINIEKILAIIHI